MLFRPSCDRFKNDATRFAPGGACSQRACASRSKTVRGCLQDTRPVLGGLRCLFSFELLQCCKRVACIHH
jgi:hypothetical protein